MKLISGASSGKLRAINSSNSSFLSAIEEDRKRKEDEKKRSQREVAIADYNAKAEKYYQEAEKANSFLGLATETAKGVGRMALGFGKEVARMPLTVPLKVTQTLTEGLTGVPQTYTPVTGVEKFLYGEQPRQSYLQDQNSIQKWGQEKGLNRGSSIALGALGAGGEVGLDLALPGFGKAIADSVVGKAMKNLANKVGIRPRVKIDETIAKEAIDEITDIQGKPPTPEEENAILDAFSSGKTKDEIVTEVGKEKVAEGFEVKPKLAEVVDQLEADGKKLTLEETQKANVLLKEGKSIEEIQMSLRTPELPQNTTQEAPKSESGTNIPDNGDEAFLKSVEERFKASKTNKFREATKDEQGRFTGSKSEKKFKTGDVERDSLSQSVQNRIDTLKEGEQYKSTQENFYDTSQRLKLEDIQSQIPKAKVEELPRLKEESDRIINEILDKRSVEFKATSKKEDIIQKARTIANNSNSSLEFRTNLRKEGLDNAFKSQQSEEEFYRRMNGAKYRLSDEDPLLQEAGKYKSAEEFVKAQGTPIYHGTAGKFDSFDDAMKGSVTGAKSAHGATWFTDNKDVAKAYSIYAAETGPVNKIMRLADDAEKVAQKSGKESDWLKYDKLVQEMEKLDTYDANFERRKLANVKEAVAKGDFYSVDAKGKTPQELSADGDIDSWLNLQVEKAKKLGKDGLVIKNIDDAVGLYDRPSTHYAFFDSKKITTKSQLTNLYNKAQGGKNRLMDDFERVTGQKITPEQEAKIIALNKKLFGDEDVKITAQILTPEGQKAFGQYKNKVIEILDGQADATDTFYHEAVHKYLDLFTTMDEQKSIYLEARKLWKTDNLDDLEEKIAENFIRYAKTNEGVIGSLKVMFDKVIDRIRVALKNESSIEALYRDILEGKAKKGNEGYTLTSKEAAKREKEILSEMRKKESEIKSMKKSTLDEEKFLAREMNSTFIFDEEEQFNYQSFKNLLKRFKTGKSREELLSGDTGSIKRVLGEKLKHSELDHILYSQEKSEDEMLDYFRGIYEKDKIKVTNDDLAARAEQRLKSDPDYVKLQDELSSIKERKLALDKVERASLEEANKELQILSAKELIEPEIVPKTEGKKTSIIASRLNEALPDDFKIDETYDPKVIKQEINKASQAIFQDKEKAIQKAFDPNTNPVERDAIFIELSEIAKRDGNFDAVSDLFQRRSELIRSGAQSLNMEKASVLLNPQEKYMRDIVNSRLGSVKVNGKDLTEVEVSAIRKTVRRETSEATKKSFKIQDAQELFNKLIC